MSHAPRPVAPARLARLHQAVDQVLQSVGFAPDAFTCQTPPNHAEARQTTPSTQPVRNKPTCHNGAVPAPRPPVLNTRQNTPFHANARHQSSVCKTNPVPTRPQRAQRPLTPNQLRAAQLLVAGHSTTAIAATLSVNRHTLATWKTKPLFQIELRRLLQSSPPMAMSAGACGGPG